MPISLLYAQLPWGAPRVGAPFQPLVGPSAAKAREVGWRSLGDHGGHVCPDANIPQLTFSWTLGHYG